MNDTRNYAMAEKPRANRPPSATASNLNQVILQAINDAEGTFTPKQLVSESVLIPDISGHIRALINLKLIKVEVVSATERFSLTPAGRTMLENRLLAID